MTYNPVRRKWYAPISYTVEEKLQGGESLGRRLEK